MLVIRMQRTGRSGHAQFRVVVQDSRRTPTSGNIVTQLGHYDPHSKQTVLDKEKAKFYLDHGAQPSPRVARLLKAEGVKLPGWVEKSAKLKAKTKNPEKLRRNRPTEPKEEAPATPAAETEAAVAGVEPESSGEPVETASDPGETTNVESEDTNQEAETKPEATGEDIAAETGETANELASEQAEAAAENADDDSAATEQSK